MANRDVGVSICGVVVGVMLGAGSVLYAQDATLSATSSDVAFRGINFDASDYDARSVADRKQGDAVEHANRPERKANDSSSHTAAPVDLSTCGVARAIAARFEMAIKSTIPNEQSDRNLQNRNSLLGVSSAVVSDYCGSGDSTDAVGDVQMDKGSAPTKVDNDCEKNCGFLERAKCEANQEKGLQYICRS